MMTCCGKRSTHLRLYATKSTYDRRAQKLKSDCFRRFPTYSLISADCTSCHWSAFFEKDDWKRGCDVWHQTQVWFYSCTRHTFSTRRYWLPGNLYTKASKHLGVFRIERVPLGKIGIPDLILQIVMPTTCFDTAQDVSGGIVWHTARIIHHGGEGRNHPCVSGCQILLQSDRTNKIAIFLK